MFRLSLRFGRAAASLVLAVAAPLTFVANASPAPGAGSDGLIAITVDRHASAFEPLLIPTGKASVLLQYHEATSAVSSKIGPSIDHWNCCQIAQAISHQAGGGGTVLRPEQARDLENAPIQADSRQYQDEELLRRVGIVLGLTYLGFLAVWFWATRFRRAH